MAQTLSAQERETGKGAARRVRSGGYLPAVVYGHKRPPRPIQIHLHRFERLLEEGSSGHGWLFTLELPGEARPVPAVLKELQRDPVTGRMIHVDFLAVDLEEQVRARVPLVARGEEELSRRGGIVQLLVRELTVEGLPEKLPNHLEVDVGALEVGQHLAAGDLTLPEGVRLAGDPAEAVLSVTHPRVEEPVAAAPAGGETSQP
ncbi:MAG: 50S ribosomal protein L25 [Thermaerobacter sp.]|nr:50S ribosomal protein L25 [Thermaerobacter sp.]